MTDGGLLCSTQIRQPHVRLVHACVHVVRTRTRGARTWANTITAGGRITDEHTQRSPSLDSRDAWSWRRGLPRRNCCCSLPACSSAHVLNEHDTARWAQRLECLGHKTADGCVPRGQPVGPTCPAVGLSPTQQFSALCALSPAARGPFGAALRYVAAARAGAAGTRRQGHGGRGGGGGRGGPRRGGWRSGY